MDRKVLVLGGGPLQIPLLKKAKEKGYRVYLADYYENPPGKPYAHETRQISTFSIEENVRYVKEKGIDYVLTIGTDQPVLTAAAVSQQQGLPHPIDEELARLCTNKSYMKARMLERDIPTPLFRCSTELKDLKLDGMRYPVVMKPADSQGQRGIFVLQGFESRLELEKMFGEAKACSRSGQVIFEEFYPGDEITVNCWVKRGRAYILMTTDRLHYDDSVVLGVCKQQRFPSYFALGHEAEIAEAVQKLVTAFGISDGPLYIQMVVGKEGAKFIEFGYRIGGGYESEIIPKVVGVDILELYFSLVTEGVNKFNPEDIRLSFKMGSIFFIFTKPGLVKKIKLPADFAINKGRIYIEEGDRLGSVENATSRVGCFEFYTDDHEKYLEFIARYEEEITILGENGEDLVLRGLWK